MSDTVTLALIDMLKSWGVAFFQNGPAWLGAIASAVVLVGGWWLSRVVADQRKALADIKESSLTSAEEAKLMVKGAERRGFEGGIATERNRASDLGRLPAYQPEKTDAFMARTDKS